MELYDPEDEETLEGEDVTSKITIIDDDQPGILGFEKRLVTSTVNSGAVQLKIQRLSGCDGEISCSFETATHQGISAAATPGVHY